MNRGTTSGCCAMLSMDAKPLFEHCQAKRFCTERTESKFDTRSRSKEDWRVLSSLGTYSCILWSFIRRGFDAREKPNQRTIYTRFATLSLYNWGWAGRAATICPFSPTAAKRSLNHEGATSRNYIAMLCNALHGREAAFRALPSQEILYRKNRKQIRYTVPKQRGLESPEQFRDLLMHFMVLHPTRFRCARKT